MPATVNIGLIRRKLVVRRIGVAVLPRKDYGYRFWRAPYGNGLELLRGFGRLGRPGLLLLIDAMFLGNLSAPY